MSDGHRHMTDRTDGTIIAECPHKDFARDAHLAVEVSYEAAVDDDVLADLRAMVSVCGECGAELDIIDYREPTEVLE